MDPQTEVLPATLTFLPAANRRAFTDLLQEARGRRTQRDMAELAGVSTGTVSSIERGIYPGLRLMDFAKVIKAYEIPPNTAFTVLGLFDPGPQNQKDYRLARALAELETLPRDSINLVLQVLGYLIEGLRK